MTVNALRGELQTIAKGAEWHASNFILDTEPDMETLADSIADFMAVYCQTGALLAADWYNSLNRESHYFAEPIAVVPPERATDTAKWIFKRPDLSVEKIANRAASAAYSMMFDAARDTVSKNATNERVAYVRVKEPGACGECKQKATMSPRSVSSASDDVQWSRHQRCEFLFEPVRSGIWVPPAHVAKWRESIRNARFAGNTNPDDIARWLDSH